ncbi:MAG: sulfatase-like hydrolase/transferase [Bryobacteraceae bacterium]|nr:sulfatase-like hydrolase/transferase [Bryobacteraceae bacterium]
MQFSRRSLLAAPALAMAASKRPNLVMILADDLGWGDLSLNGAPDISTPNIDSLARDGVRFTQSYSNAPECSPARCALLTGRYQQRAGGLECAIGVGDTGRYDEAAWLQSRGELGLPPADATLAPSLAKAGYDVALFGKWHLGYREKFLPVRQGFHEFFGILGGAADYYTHEEPNEGRGQKPLYLNETRVDRAGNLTDLFTEAALDWLGKRGGRPFFLYLPFTAPHDPLQNPAEFDPAAGTAPQRPKDRKTYAAMVQHLDRCVGGILARLDRMGAAQNTLVVFHSDNGGTAVGRNSPWRGGKSSVFEGGIRSPLLLRWPGRLKAGATSSQPALTMDITATLLAAAGVAPQGLRLDGMDLLPYASGSRPPAARTLFWRYKRAANRRKAVRDGRWKYVFDSGAEFLFDLESDPGESKNLLPANPAKVAELKSELTSWEAETMAPRLREFYATQR